VVAKAKGCVNVFVAKRHEASSKAPICPAPPDFLVENCAVYLLNSESWEDWTQAPSLLGAGPGGGGNDDGPKRREITGCLDVVCLIRKLVVEAAQEKPSREVLKVAKLVWENGEFKKWLAQY
jgi:hypothetical protein